MSVEIKMLVWSAALLLVLVFLQATSAIMQNGAIKMAGPRDDLPPPGKIQARMKRVVDNHREGLALFAPLVLAAALAGVSSGLTVLGAQLFFYSRIVHAALYISGAPLVRPLAWGVGVAGLILILIELIGAM
jgi:uncharacterized MAPEG superfamily protein